MKLRGNKKKIYLFIGSALLLLVAIGYAYLSTTLNITGQSKIEKTTWDIHFENIIVKEGSITPTTQASITNNSTQVDFSINLKAPGEFYEFTVDVVNAGSIDAMVSEVLVGGITSEQAVYTEYKVTYADEAAISEKDLLSAGKKVTIKVRIKFKDDVISSQLPTEDQTLSLAFKVTYIQADDTAKEVVPSPVSFTTDSWETIIRSVKAGKIDKYSVGATKEVDMGEFGIHTVRVANTSTPKECEAAGYSQTACGFVVEFANNITTHAMYYLVDGPERGWPASDLRTYIQNTIIPALPTELQSGIIDTTVVSGHGRDDTNNFISTDKLYLLSPKEIWGIDTSGNYHDTSGTETRQLDYYNSIGVTLDNYSGASKQYNNSEISWWLRSNRADSINGYHTVLNTGGWHAQSPHVTGYGVSPAFRIG